MKGVVVWGGKMGKGGNSRLLSTRGRFLKVNNRVSLILGKYTMFRRSTAYYVPIPRLDADFNTCFYTGVFGGNHVYHLLGGLFAPHALSISSIIHSSACYSLEVFRY